MDIRNIIQAAYDAYEARDLEGAMAAFSDDVRFDWAVDGCNKRCGCSTGLDGMRERLISLAEDFDYLSFKLEHLIVEENRAAARVVMELKSKKTGETITNRSAQFWRFEGDKAVELVEYYDTALVGAHQS